MRIAIDASSMLPPRTGIGVYTRQLVAAMPRLAPQHDFRLFCNSLRRPYVTGLEFELPNVARRRLRIPGPLLIKAWQHLHAPSIETLSGKFDVFHSPATYIPPQEHGASVTTIHDLYFLDHPEQCHSLGGKYLLATLPRALPRMDRIICVSTHTRDTLLNRFPVDPARVQVIHSGVDRALFQPFENRQAIHTLLDSYKLPHRYILAVATLEPRKNIGGLLRAFDFARKHTPRGTVPPLVVVGGKGWDIKSIFPELSDMRLVLKENVFEDIFFTGFVPEEHLSPLYNGAELFVMPSLDEGFGFPVLEAMACGTPVLASLAPGLREIAGGAARHADATDPEAFGQSIIDILGEESKLAALRQAGLIRAAQFDWDQTAQQTIAVYEEAYRDRAGRAL